MIALCDNCRSIAVWNYMPGKGDRYKCDEHVPRGCSCNINLGSNEEDKDEQGRLLPCCEWDYNPKGFRIQK